MSGKETGADRPQAAVEPPREGLIPGTWRMVDPKRLGLVDRPRLPVRWTSRHVGMRLIEAHRVIARMPASIWPRSYGTAWPGYRQEFGDAVAQENAGTVQAVRGSIRVGAGADEIARTNEAVAWPMQFLSHDAAKASDVNLWASQVTEEEFEKIDDGDLSVPWDGLQMIAAALNAANEVVR